MICENAASQIFTFQSICQSGFSNALMPMPAPGRVNAKIIIKAIMPKSRGINIFEALPIPSFKSLCEIYQTKIHTITIEMVVGIIKLAMSDKFELPPTLFTKYSAESAPQLKLKLDPK